ncbi:MAG: hypothetical protein ACP5OA_03440 [Candidatus Woesearchaeota archaeon]
MFLSWSSEAHFLAEGIPLWNNELITRWYPYTVLQKIWIKKEGDLPEKGDIVVSLFNDKTIGPIVGLVDYNPKLVGLKRSGTTKYWITFWRYATKEEIMNFYNK